MMSSRPITRGHKPSASQDSNTLSTMSEVSCTTTLSIESEFTEGCKEEERLEDFTEDKENVAESRSDNEETVDVVVVVRTVGEEEKR